MILLLFTQFFDIYAPERPLLFESGATLIPTAVDMDFYYTITGNDTGVVKSLYARLMLDITGFDDFSISFPWIWYRDSLTSGFGGDISFSYKRCFFKSSKFGYFSSGIFIRFPTAKDTLGFRTPFIYFVPFVSYSYEYSFVTLNFSFQDTILTYDTNNKDFKRYNGTVLFGDFYLEFMDIRAGVEFSSNDILLFAGLRRGNWCFYVGKEKKGYLLILRLYL